MDSKIENRRRLSLAGTRPCTHSIASFSRSGLSVLFGILRKDSCLHQFPAQLESRGMIDRKNMNRCTAGRRQSDESRSSPAKMLGPAVATGMKETDKFMCFNVNARNIRPFASIASAAREGQIAR